MSAFKVNQKLYNEYGEHFGTPQVTLKDVIIQALLAPVRDEMGRLNDPDSSFKYKLFIQLLPLVEEDVVVDLPAEQIAMIKKAAKIHPPLFLGQIEAMVEGKFDATPFEIMAKYREANKPNEPEINMEVILQIRKILEGLVNMLK